MGRRRGRNRPLTLVNVDPLNPTNRPSPVLVKELGMGGVRLVCREGVEGYVDLCHGQGLFVLGVIARESQGNVLGGICDAYQIGNEPDGEGESSYSMSPNQYLEEARIYRDTYPGLFMISAGLVSGQVGYWRQIGSQIGMMGYQGFAVHPYGKTAAQAEPLLKSYQSITPRLGLWVTEWHRPANEIPDWKAMLRRTSVADAWFCWAYGGWDLTPEHARALQV